MTSTKPETLLSKEKAHLANLLEAIQRCVYFLNASHEAVEWPLTDTILFSRKKGQRSF